MDDLSFLNELERTSGEAVSACYQCYKCTNGCPVAQEMDIHPHRVIRHIILGDREKVLTSQSIWICLQCVTCSVRCPNDIDIARVFDTLRKIAVTEGLAAEKDTWTFDTLFLESVRKHGRLCEMETMVKYKLAKKDLFSDTKMGMHLLLKGRMGLFSHNIKGRKQMKEIFRKIKG